MKLLFFESLSLSTKRLFFNCIAIDFEKERENFSIALEAIGKTLFKKRARKRLVESLEDLYKREANIFRANEWNGMPI